MRVAKVINYDVNNGDGFRVSVWVTGCPIKCAGCHNKDLWNENLGTDYSIEVADKIVELLQDDNIQGLSILGGEPLAHYNFSGVSHLCDYVKKRVPNKSIWLWTGYTVQEGSPITEIVDVIIDGQFVEDLKDPKLQWRGSSNQRIIKTK